MPNRNAQLGLWLFAIYLAFYSGFVYLAAFQPQVLQRTPWAGVNFAIWYGFALIAAAFVLALLYGWLCRTGNRSEPGRPAPGGLSTTIDFQKPPASGEKS